MKVLYAIQGTGNGHLSRARDIVPLLKQRVEVDVLISSMKRKQELPYEVKFLYKGMGFTFGKKGGIDLWDTWKRANLRKFRKEVNSLPIEDYDLLINDFEPVSAWAARLKKVPSVSLSHQAAVLHKKAPKPKNADMVGKRVLKYFAPTDRQFGFHFERYDENIYTPVIRQQVRGQVIKNFGHYTVYLPAYGDKKLIHKLSRFSRVTWEVFSKHAKEPYTLKNVKIFPVNNEAFIKSMASCEGVLCGAGFETPAEALFLGKKLMVVPMKAQYEQQCNAKALEKMGVPVMKNLKEKRLAKIGAWLNSIQHIDVDYPDETEQILDQILGEYGSKDEEKEELSLWV